jgi:hypothetical protein
MDVRKPSQTVTGPTPARERSRPGSSFISLGKVILALYFMTLLAAFISARALSEDGGGVSGTPAPQPPTTQSSTALSEAFSRYT